MQLLVSFSIEANYHLRNKVIFTIRFISGLKNFDSKIFNGIKKNTVRVARRYSKVLGALAGKASILHPGIGGIMDIVGKIAGKVVLGTDPKVISLAIQHMLLPLLQNPPSVFILFIPQNIGLSAEQLTDQQLVLPLVPVLATKLLLKQNNNQFIMRRRTVLLSTLNAKRPLAEFVKFSISEFNKYVVLPEPNAPTI
ncbi:MAG: hypothetical protein EZS28_010250 [Streblomastix strix]|uniref:Uncharacterized protein n=1 Tax=Streblomastix strix TaxID=222440 RepID=A0A5J4WHN9_9EUKA|nr:MAG: hypothetical protein EZS28_010250 [Streblomastix strix]